MGIARILVRPFPLGIFQYSNLTFTPDSKHLFWRGALPPYGYRIFVDRKPAFDGQYNQGTTLYSKEGWQMGADGTLTVLTTDATSQKRVNISVAPWRAVEKSTRHVPFIVPGKFGLTGYEYMIAGGTP